MWTSHFRTGLDLESTSWKAVEVRKIEESCTIGWFGRLGASVGVPDVPSRSNCIACCETSEDESSGTTGSCMRRGEIGQRHEALRVPAWEKSSREQSHPPFPLHRDRLTVGNASPRKSTPTLRTSTWWWCSRSTPQDVAGREEAESSTAPSLSHGDEIPNIRMTFVQDAPEERRNSYNVGYHYMTWRRGDARAGEMT